jgi:hypothetical protein
LCNGGHDKTGVHAKAATLIAAVPYDNGGVVRQPPDLVLELQELKGVIGVGVMVLLGVLHVVEQHDPNLVSRVIEDIILNG